MRQSFARKPTTYWLPRLLIVASKTAALPVRSHTSRAISGVRRASDGWPIRRSTACMRSSEIRLRNGDCSSCTARPCRKVPSNTGSPVVFAKSARTIVSLSVSLGGGRWKYKYPPTHTTNTAATARTTAIPRFLIRAEIPVAAVAGSCAESVSRLSRRRSARISEAC